MLLSSALISSTKKNELKVALVIVFCENWYILLRNRLHFEGHFCIFGPQNEGFKQVFQYFLIWFVNGEVQIKRYNLVIILMNDDHSYTSVRVTIFWSNGLAIASEGPLNLGPSVSLCLSVCLPPAFPENRAIEFSNFLHVT